MLVAWRSSHRSRRLLRRNFIYALDDKIKHRKYKVIPGKSQLNISFLCRQRNYVVLPETALSDIKFLRRRSRHLLHERATIRPEEAQSRRALLNNHLLKKYNDLISNIEKSYLPWNAEQRKCSIKKLLKLDTNYLESFLRPEKVSREEALLLLASMKKEPITRKLPEEAYPTRRQRLANSLNRRIDKTQLQLDLKISASTPEETQWNDNFSREYDKLYRNIGKNSPYWSWGQVREHNNDFITLEIKYIKRILSLQYTKKMN
jgi:hypothetical protein